MGLEILMLIVYSSWLNLTGKMTDFLIISIVGHYSYGATIGLLNQYKFMFDLVINLFKKSCYK